MFAEKKREKQRRVASDTGLSVCQKSVHIDIAYLALNLAPTDSPPMSAYSCEHNDCLLEAFATKHNQSTTAVTN